MSIIPPSPAPKPPAPKSINSPRRAAPMLEDYPDDKYGASCLLLGFTNSGRALHLHCSYPSRPLVKIITVYEPDTAEWLNWRVRKRDYAKHS